MNETKPMVSISLQEYNTLIEQVEAFKNQPAKYCVHYDDFFGRNTIVTNNEIIQDMAIEIDKLQAKIIELKNQKKSFIRKFLNI